MTQVKTKFRVDTVLDNGNYKQAKLSAAYGGDKNSEDNQFSSATPAGSINITVTNPDTKDFLQPGKKYYVYFEECADQS